MNRETDVPVFGRQVEGCPYIVQPSAYALVRREGDELAIARTAGTFFLVAGWRGNLGTGDRTGGDGGVRFGVASAFSIGKSHTDRVFTG